MRRSIFILLIAVIFNSCSTSKQSTESNPLESKRTTERNIEGEKVTVETLKMQGIEMSESLNEEGTELVKYPFKWYAGTGKADNKQMAIELAQREAYSTISRVLNNAVISQAERGNVSNNGRVQQALTSHWEQVSYSLQQGCEPFGEVKIEYNKIDGMYNATARVAIRGDRFNKLIDSAGNFKPEDLKGEDLEEFLIINKQIMEATKSN